MKCTGKEWDTCRVEKMGCKGCYYDEIEAGEYIRTKKGKITRVINVEIENYKDGTTEVFIETELNPGYLDYTNKDILKHSKNIIDLIVVGDYVNLERVLDITGEYIRTTETIHNKYWLLNNITSIVTKELFKLVEYKMEN